MGIHETAVVHESAQLGDVEIGPFAVVGQHVVLADGVVVGAHAVVQGHTTVGEGTQIHAHACVGGPPQDRQHDGSVTRLIIGRRNVIREFVTMHVGSSAGRGVTTVGDDNYFMANSHIAHDCEIGSGCTFANSAAVAGHCQVGDGAVFGGLAGVHQHVRIGRLSMVGAGAMCAQDVPPFTIAQGDRARLFGLNIVGLRREGVDAETMRSLKTAWRRVFSSGSSMRTGINQARDAAGDTAEVIELLDFLDSATRGVCRGASVGTKG